jgi:hypothetical protein
MLTVTFVRAHSPKMILVEGSANTTWTVRSLYPILLLAAARKKRSDITKKADPDSRFVNETAGLWWA